MADEKIFGERLTDEQLENVAGGNLVELQKDANLLHDLGLISAITFRSGTEYSVAGYNTRDNNFYSVKRAWAQVGITVIDNFRKNEYYYEGKSIPRDEAMKVAMEKVGKKVDIRPYLKV